MAGPGEEPDGAGAAFVRRVRAEAVLLDVGDGLHEEADCPQNGADDVGGGSEGRVRVLGDVGRVEDGDGEGDGPDPDHLEDPEAEEGPELVALVVEAVVLARFEDAEEEEGGEPGAPEEDEEGVDDLAGVGGGGVGGAGGEGEGEDGEDDEVGPAGEVGELVEFEGERDAEADELVGDRDEEGDDEVVVV